jgi:hypothetical protein
MRNQIHKKSNMSRIIDEMVVQQKSIKKSNQLEISLQKELQKHLLKLSKKTLQMFVRRK